MTQRKRVYLLLFSFLVMTACTAPAPFHHEYASGHYSSDIQQCALYARDVSGVQLYGAADSWWQEAAGKYQRGHKPKSGAILVLKKTERMHGGHVAVVKTVLNAREITVTHSNWGETRKMRHIIFDSMLVRDVSPANDWSQVRFWNDDKNVLGFPYAAYGFIYP